MIKAAYLYYDLLNLYGEGGNIKALEYHLNSSGNKMVTDKLKLGDRINFSKYDLVYIGSGTEHNLMIALDDIMQYREELTAFKNSGGILISTGNSIELFGKSIDTGKTKKQGLSLFDFTVKYSDRTVRDVCTKCSLINEDIIGFENHSGKLSTDESIITDNNFILTYIIGPILVRNPSLTQYVIRKLAERNPDENIVIDSDYSFETEAYNIFKSSVSYTKDK